MYYHVVIIYYHYMEDHMHIVYHTAGNSTYARLAESYREGNLVKKRTTNLGKVIDKDKGIYQNRERGIFQFDISTMQYQEVSSRDNPGSAYKDGLLAEKLILDFGDTYLLDQFLANSGLKAAIDAVACKNKDTLYAMVCYYVFCNAANCHALSWYEGNYARIIYPDAKMSSQRVSEFLAESGNEAIYRGFFTEYLKYFTSHAQEGGGVIIDSTGLPNSVHFPLTAISNHNGEINEEARLIFVTQQETGMPLYFRYCPGNVIDVNTLIRTMKELKQCGVSTKFAILDAGYYSDENIRELYENGVSFITRLKENRKVYKELLSEHLGMLEAKENFVRYNERFAYIKRVKCELVTGYTSYAYIGLDIARKGSESKKLFKSAKARNLTDEDVYNQMATQGIFILVSSRQIARDKILPLYYTRQNVEQIFDIGKNYADMLPLRIQTEDTFRGHLLLTFIATVIVKMIQDQLIDSPYNPISMFMNLRNLKCKVYEDRIITGEPFKKANDCFKLFKIKCPDELLLP